MTNLSAQISVSGEDFTRTMHPNFVGFNANTSNVAFPWGNADRREALSKTRTTNFRYPGGTVSSYWDHEKGRLFSLNHGDYIDLTQTEPRKYVQKKYVINWATYFYNAPNPMYNFKLAYDEMNGEMDVVFVLNMVTPGYDFYEELWDRTVDQTPGSVDWYEMMNDRYYRAQNMLDQAVNQGVPVKFVELGNEYYFGTSLAGTGANGGANVEPYSAGAFNDGIVGAFPWEGKAYAIAVNDWTTRLKARYSGVKICALGSDANGAESTRRNDWNEKVLGDVDFNNTDAFSIHFYEGINDGNLTSNENNLGIGLTAWIDHWIEMKGWSNFPAGVPLWITEFNAEDGIGTWGNGLHAVFANLYWLEHENIELSQYHQFLEDVQDGANITGAGRALSLMALATAKHTSATRLNLSGNTSLSGSGGELQEVEAWAFTGAPGGKSKYLIVNFSENTRSFNTSAISGANGKTYTQAGQQLSTTTTSPTESMGTISGNSISLPKFSMTVFEADATNGNQSPTATITSPSNGANFTKGTSITIQAIASDTDGSISKVEFYEGNNKLGEDASAPYSFIWSSPTVGSYSLTAKAIDNNNAEGTSNAIAVTVSGSSTTSSYRFLRIEGLATVQNESTIVELTWLENDSEYPTPKLTSTTSYQATASTENSNAWRAYDGTTNGWYVGFNYPATNTIDLGTGNEISPTGIKIKANAPNRGFKDFNIYGSNDNKNWDLLHAETGLTNADYPTPDKEVTVSFAGAPSNQAPTVSLTSPSNNASFIAGDNISISATASDSDGSISKVEFYRGETKIGEDTSSPYSVTWTNALEGAYTITVKATDNNGATTTSSSHSVDVLAVSTAYRYLRIEGRSHFGLESTIVELKWLVNGNEYPTPKLTSTNSGDVTASTDNGNAWKTYDGSNNGWFVGFSLPAINTIDLGAGNEISPTGIKVKANAPNRGFEDFDVYGSNDNSNWTLIQSVSGLTTADYPQPDKEATVTFSGSARVRSSVSESSNAVLRLYPNPFQQVLRIQGNQLKAENVEVVNVMGMRVFPTLTEIVGGIELDFHRLKKGLYIVRELNNQVSHSVIFE